MSDEILIDGKLQSFKDENSKNAFFLQEGKNIGIDPTEHPIITNIDQLDIKVSENGFNNVKVVRLEDLYVEDIDVYHLNNDTEYSGIPGQYLGDDLNLENTKVRVYYTSDSGVNIIKEHDITNDSVKLCKANYSELPNLKITSESKYLKYSFTYQDQEVVKYYSINSVKKLIKVTEYVWPDYQYTNTTINTYRLQIELTLQTDYNGEDKVEEKIVCSYSNPLTDFSFNLEKDKWGNDSGNQNVELICTYHLSEKEGFHLDEEKSISLLKDVIKKAPKENGISFIIKSLSSDKKYYLNNIEDSLVCTYLKVEYNSGDVLIQRNEDGLDNVTLYTHFTRKLDSYNDTIDKYILNIDGSFEKYTGTEPLTEGYTKQWFSVSELSYSQRLIVAFEDDRDGTDNKLYGFKEGANYTINAEFDSLAFTDFPDQYENTSFNLTDVKLKSIYKNGSIIETPISMNNIEIVVSETYSYENNKWVWLLSDDTPTLEVTLNITYTYDYPESKTLEDVKINLIKESIDFIESTDDNYAFTAGSEINVNKLNIIKVFNSGRTEKDNPSKVQDLNGNDLTLFDTFENKDNVTVEDINKLEEEKTYRLFFSGKTCEKSIILKRNFSKLEPLKEDNTRYSFQEDPHFLSKDVRVDSLSKVKIIYTDNSYSTIVLVEEEDSAGKLERLKTDYKITLYTSKWNKKKEQSNYFIFRPSQYRYTSESELVAFDIVVSEILVSLKSSDKLIYQGQDVKEALKHNFNYTLTLDSEEPEVVTVYDFEKLEDYNAIVNPVDDNGENIENWPKTLSDSLYNTELIKFKCSPIKKDSFDICYSNEINVNLYRVVESIKLAKENSDNYNDTLEISDIRIIGNPIVSSSDYGKVRVIFTNGYVKDLTDDTDFSKLYAYIAIENNINKLCYTWPKSGEFKLSYTEIGDTISFDPYATIRCTNCKSLIEKMVITSRILEAGSKVEKNDLTVKLYGLDEEEVEYDPNNLELKNNKTSSYSTEAIVYAIYRYISPLDGETKEVKSTFVVSLNQKNCTIKYEYYKKNSGIEQKINTIESVAAETSYTVKESSQKVDLIFSSEKFPSAQTPYVFSNVKAFNSDTMAELSNFTYDPSTKKLTIPEKVDCNLLIRIYLNGEVSEDGYGHMYSNIDGVLTGVYDTASATDTYKIPDGVTTIKSGFFNNSTKIKTLIINNGVTRICDSAFSGCSKLTEIKFGERTSKISIGQKAFYNCTSLSTLDFLECGDIREHFIIGTPDSSPTSSIVVRNTWTGCKLRTIKVNKNSFTPILRHYYIDGSSSNYNVWLTGRCGGGFKAQIECWYRSYLNRSHRFLEIFKAFIWKITKNDIATHESWIKSLQKSYNSSSNFSGDTYFHHCTSILSEGSKKVWSNSFWTYDKGSSYSEKNDSSIVNRAGSYDFSKKCAASIRSDHHTSIWLVCYGMNHDSFNYDKVVSEGYNFTTNGRVGSEYVSSETGSIGTHFGNWENKDYVNDCIYPNVKLSNNSISDDNVNTAFNSFNVDERVKYNNYVCGTYLDFMIPLYN